MKRGMELGLNTIIILIVCMVVLLIVMLYFSSGARDTFGKMTDFGKSAVRSGDTVAEGIGAIIADCPGGHWPLNDESCDGVCDIDCGTNCECGPVGNACVCKKKGT